MAKRVDDHADLDLKDPLVNEAEKKNEADFLRVVRERSVYGWTRWRKNYQMAREDVSFLSGEGQWDDNARKYREMDGRPVLTFNDLPQYVDQITNDQRQNGPSIHVSPSDAAAGEGKMMNINGKELKASEVFEGICRDIEYQSQAEDHYDRAHQHAVEAGFGWLRVFTTYANPKTFDLDIRIKSVKNRWSVLMDPDAQEPDYSDANWCFVFDQMQKYEYDVHYPNTPVGTLDEKEREVWGGKDWVSVAEYFERHAIKRKLLLMTDGRTFWEDEVKDVIAEMQADGLMVQRERTVDTHQIHWWKLTANGVLRGPVVIPCSTIPVIPVLGKEINIDGTSDYRGAIRHAKDPKRTENYWLTAMTERVALTPKAPWLVTERAIDGYEADWAQANTKTPSVLVYNEGATPPKRQDPATMPAAELQVAAVMTDKVKSTIGMYSAAIGAQSNETSGKAILARQHEADVGSFTYIDNLSKAIRRVGLICVEMIPKVYDTNRKMRMRNVDGTGDWIEVNKTIEGDDGKPHVVNDLAEGAFDVVVKTGPSYSTQRAEAAEALMEFMRVAPSVGAMIVDLVAETMDWPGAREIAKRLRHTIPRHMLTEEQVEELGEMPEPQPTPADQADMAKAEADMARAEADTLMAEAKSKEAEAKLAEIRAMGAGNPQMQMITDIIEQTIARVLEQGANDDRAGNEGG